MEQKLNRSAEPGIGDGTAAILVKDDAIGYGCEFAEWLRSEGFHCWKYHKGWYTGVNRMYVNLNSKLMSAGMPGIGITRPFGEHAVTIEEFKIIYAIYKKYEEQSVLEM